MPSDWHGTPEGNFNFGTTGMPEPPGSSVSGLMRVGIDGARGREDSNIFWPVTGRDSNRTQGWAVLRHPVFCRAFSSGRA